MTTLATLNIDTEPLCKLQEAAALEEKTCGACGGQGLLEGPCDCEDPPLMERHLVQCQGCNGTGTVPLLAGVRVRQEAHKPCPGKGFCSVAERHWGRDCRGRGWVATDSTWRYVEAAAKIGIYTKVEHSCNKAEGLVIIVSARNWSRRHAAFEHPPDAANLYLMRAIAHALVAMREG